MTYQDVLDALDSILEKLRGNNSELCEKLGIEIDDPYINGEEVDSEENDSEDLGSDEVDVEDVDVEVDNVDNADNEQLADDEDESSVNEAGSNASDTEPGMIRRAADTVSDAWNKTTKWAKDNPGAAITAAAGTGLAAALIGGMLFGDDEEDESTQQSFNESNSETKVGDKTTAVTDDEPKAGDTEPKAGDTEPEPQSEELNFEDIVVSNEDDEPSGSPSDNDAFGLQKAADKAKSGAIIGGALIGGGLLSSALLKRRRRRRRS